MKSGMSGVRICAVAIAAAFLLLPSAAFGQSPQDTDTGRYVKIEYRYTEGEQDKLSVPNTIARFGQNYHLIDRQAPVLEKTLPATRVYTWRVDGIVSEAELAELEGIEGLELTPVEAPVERIVDKSETIVGLATNDVDAIPYTKKFQIASESAADADATNEAELTRAAVRFEVEAYDQYGLPNSYKAEVVYRGLETTMEAGYYEAKASYTTAEPLDGVAQYVVVATYAPDAAAGTGAASSGTGGTDGTGAAGGDDAAGDTVTAAVTPPVDAGTDTDNADIADGPVPASDGGAKDTVSFRPWMLTVPLVVALAALAYLWLRRRQRERAKNREARREARRRASLRSYGLVDYDE